VALAAAGFALAGTVSVTLGPKGPQPATVTVEWGDTLAFVNGDSVTHGLTSPRPEFSTTSISPGATYAAAVTNRAGAYQFRQTGGKSFVGTVVVTATGTVTLKASATTVIYGRPVLLTGVASKPDTSVMIEQRLTGDTAWRSLGTVTSAADGTFADSVQLPLSARLRASTAGGQIRSATVTVALKPTLTLSANARRTKVGRSIPVSVRLTPGKAATRVTLFECTPYSGGWRAVVAKPPGLSGRITFRWTAGYGRTLLRAAVERRYVAAGFETQQSGTISITATGAPPAKSHPKRGC
jgi:plastocyanin